MKAVLLDRDGVINALVYHEDTGIIDSPLTLDEFHILPRVPQAIRLVNDLGLKVAIVSNQPGIAKGHLQEQILADQDKAILDAVKQASAHLDGIYYCLHHPQALVAELRQVCQCRKPGTGLLEQASRDLGIALTECYMIGDGIPDLEAGWRAGCRTIFIGRWKCELCRFLKDGARPHLVAESLWEACCLIRQELAGEAATMVESGAGKA